MQMLGPLKGIGGDQDILFRPGLLASGASLVLPEAPHPLCISAFSHSRGGGFHVTSGDQHPTSWVALMFYCSLPQGLPRSPL